MGVLWLIFEMNFSKEVFFCVSTNLSAFGLSYFEICNVFVCVVCFGFSEHVFFVFNSLGAVVVEPRFVFPWVCAEFWYVSVSDF